MCATALPADIETMEARLAAQLGDPLVAYSLCEIVCSDVLQWTAPSVALEDVSCIVGYTFGNRIDANGNRSSGPVNEALANVAVQLHRLTGVPVYAQWEVASAIGDRISAEQLTSITPLRNAQAETVYLSTAGVAAAVVQHAGDAKKLGKVAVVAFRDHIKRCVDTSRRVGMDAAAPDGYEMPATYDERSGQPWTRTRLIYLLHDLRCRIEDRRDQLIAGSQSASEGLGRST